LIRTILIIIFVYLCFKLVKDMVLKYLLSNYKNASFRNAPRNTSRYIDEMVKDPVCEVYIPKRNAVAATFSGEEHFFCSRECMLKFKEKKSA
jgi:YHS domain-containing protein